MPEMAPLLHFPSSAAKTGGEDTPRRGSMISLQEDVMSKIKKNVKSVLNQKARIGFFTVPLWVVGAVYLARHIRDRRRLASVSA